MSIQIFRPTEHILNNLAHVLDISAAQYIYLEF